MQVSLRTIKPAGWLEEREIKKYVSGFYVGFSSLCGEPAVGQSASAASSLRGVSEASTLL